MAPIHRLPAELLLQVWADVVDACADGFQSSSRLAGVCSFWRQLALASQGLWCHVKDAPEKIVWCQLERSRQAPLSITYETRSSRFSNIGVGSYIAACSELRRTRSMHFTLKSEEGMTLLSAALAGGQLPVLETLDITIQATQPLTTVSLDCITPRLQSLVLRNMKSPMTSLMFTSSVALRRLHIDYGRDTVMSATSMVQFLDVLRGTPALEGLSFHGKLSPLPFGEMVPLVQLPVLRDIAFTDILAVIADVFDHLEAPSITGLSIAVPRDDRFVVEDVDRSISAITPFALRCAASITARGLFIKSDPRQLALELYSLPFQLGGKCTRTPSFRFICNLNHNAERNMSHLIQSNVTQTLLSALNPHDVALRANNPLAEVVLVLWTYCPLAQTLTLVGPSSPRVPAPILSAFASLPEPVREMMLRNIRQLTLAGIAFDFARVDMILDAFQGSFFDKLVIAHPCEVRSEHLGILHNLASVVSCDNIVVDSTF